jgi:hypothetical protein
MSAIDKVLANPKATQKQIVNAMDKLNAATDKYANSLLNKIDTQSGSNPPDTSGPIENSGFSYGGNLTATPAAPQPDPIVTLPVKTATPDIVLFDEPFAALDAQTRLLMQELVCDLQRQGVCGTMVFVTHAIDEALIVADRIIVMSARPGRIIADVTPQLPDVPIAQKRALPAFTQAFAEIWAQIRNEVELQMHEEVR